MLLSATSSKKNRKRAPAELSWVLNNLPDFDHLKFFEHFTGHSKRKITDAFRIIIRYWIEDDQLKEKLQVNYDNWKRSNESKLYWKSRNNGTEQEENVVEQENLLSSTSITEPSVVTVTMNDSLTNKSDVEIAVEDIKSMISWSEGEDIFFCEINLTAVIREIQSFTLNCLETRKLTYESHTHCLLSISSIILITRNPAPGSVQVFSLSPNIIRHKMLRYYGINVEKFPRSLLVELLDLVVLVDQERMTRLEAQAHLTQKQLQLGLYERKLVGYLLKAIQELPFVAPENVVLETKLCSRYLLAVFRSLFEDLEGTEPKAIFDFTSTPNEESLIASEYTNKRPDGIISSHGNKTIGFMEVKPLSDAAVKCKVNLDVYRLGVFCKNAIDAHNLKCAMAVQAVGTNITFFLVERHGKIFTMTELHHLRFPTLITELASFIGYFDKLLEVVKIFYSRCVENNTSSDGFTSPSTLKSPLLRSIVNQSANRKRKSHSQYSYF